MARITREQSDSLSPSSGNWFKLSNDKDTALIQFPYTHPEDIGRYSVHKLSVEGNNNGATYMVDCIRELEDSVEACPLCDVGEATVSANLLQFYNHNTGRVEVWERSNKFLERVEALMDTYGYEDFNYRVFQIQRLGAKGDLKTTYDFNLMDRVDPIDWNDPSLDCPNIVGSTIRAASFEDMEQFLETGQWPQQDQQQNTARRPAGRQQAAPANRRPAPAQRPAPAANRPAAAPPAASARRAPTAASAPRGGSRGGSRAGGGEEQF